MGSPLSPIITDIVLQDLEARALESIRYIPSLYFRYVDDVVMASPSHLIEHTLQIFNSFHPRLKFMLEIEENSRLNFLDISLISFNKKIIFDWYHKPTFSERFLNFFSHHPTCQKRGTVIDLMDRAFLLSHPEFHVKNIKLIIGILLENGYPLKLIFNTINNRLSHLINISNNNNSRKPNKDENVSYFTIPYLPPLTNNFKNILKDTDNCRLDRRYPKLSYFSLNKLNTVIKTHKDPIPKLNKKNVV